MTSFIKIYIVLAYLSIALELIFFHVPSIASNVNLVKANDDVVNNYSASRQNVFRLSLFKKILFFFIPLIMIYLTFALPIFYILDARDLTIPLQMGAAQPALTLIGVLGIFIGRFITFRSVLTIRKDNQQIDDSFHLHTGKLFDMTRNPGLLGMYVFIIGVWMIMPSYLFAIGIAVYFAYMHYKVLMEEDFLANKFGKQYLNYKNNTHRYLPF